ncbi:isochorismatase family protein [Candidatus Albibeggiatoa sp. nov. NOAA]|uniref:isochorismatase family protein n=1 Tax=Candidatus Albibeggiatoa sp. nov. NOAA TaxID=3162724 RepID=UPI0032F56728|nr:isochorismatase family protein [Thiotrichaceae bacterium]
MAIPKIATYPIPSTDNLPHQRLTWQPEASRVALLIHDMQDYFLDFYDVEAEPIPTLVSNLLALRDRCDALRIPVIYTAQPGQQQESQRGLLTPFWGAGVTAKPERATIFSPLAPKPQHHVLDKWRYSAFQRSPFEDLLREAGRDQLIIGGIYAHIGVLMSAGEAFMRDIQPCVVADAVADFSPERHAMALDYVASTCGAIRTSAELLEALPVASTQPTLRDRLAKLLDIQAAEIGADDNLMELGLDSIRLMSLIEELRAAGHSVKLETLAECMTLSAWNSVLEEAPRAA